MEKDEEKPREMSWEEQERLMAAKERIKQGWPREIEVRGRKYRVKQVSKRVRAEINALEIEAYVLSGKQKEAKAVKEAKRIQGKLDELHAKTAAWYLVGNRGLWVPGLWQWKWRSLMREPEEVAAAINGAAFDDEEVGFSFANWENTKQRLALSMRPIGEGVRQTMERWRAAEAQAAEDATKRKAEGSR